MKYKGLISVIVPVYNTGKYLEECLQGIVNQSYRNLDIIIVDDGSTDNSMEIAERFRSEDTRVRIIRNKKNSGISYSRNVGLDNARGEYVAWCDSDDVYHPLFVETLYNILLKENVDFVECLPISAPKYTQGIFNDTIYTDDIKVGDAENFVLRFGTHELQTSLWSKLFKKELFKAFRFPIGHIYEENYFYIYLYQHSLINKCAYLSQPLYFYRSRENSIMKHFRIQEFNEELLTVNLFKSFAATLRQCEKEIFEEKIFKLLVKCWQRSMELEIPLRKKIEMNKLIVHEMNNCKIINGGAKNA